MKAVKQRFPQWYNGRVERKGTLWEEREGVDEEGRAVRGALKGEEMVKVFG